MVTMLKKSDTMAMKVTTEVRPWVAPGIGATRLRLRLRSVTTRSIPQKGQLVSGSFRDSRVSTQWREREVSVRTQRLNVWR